MRRRGLYSKAIAKLAEESHQIEKSERDSSTTLRSAQNDNRQYNLPQKIFIAQRKGIINNRKRKRAGAGAGKILIVDIEKYVIFAGNAIKQEI